MHALLCGINSEVFFPGVERLRFERLSSFAGIPGRKIRCRLGSEENTAVENPGLKAGTLGPADLDVYQGERGRRGKMLPRGFQRVESVEIA